MKFLSFQVVLPKLPGLSRESVSWFTHVWPLSQKPDWTTEKPLNAVQGPGEVIFVPAGWWHAVLNLDLSLALTHNYCSTANFDSVWRHAKRGRPKMALKWLDRLKEVCRVAIPRCIEHFAEQWSLKGGIEQECSRIWKCFSSCCFSAHVFFWEES
jgi:hypothetical protein